MYMLDFEVLLMRIQNELSFQFVSICLKEREVYEVRFLVFPSPTKTKTRIESSSTGNSDKGLTCK